MALTVTLALAAFLALMAIVVLLAHPQLAGLGPSPGLVNKQNQTGKSLLYLVTFAVILPTAVILVPRLADAIAAGPNGAALGTLSALIVSSLALLLIALRLSHRLPWGDGLKVVLVGALIWAAVAGAALARSAAGGPWPALVRLAALRRTAWLCAGVLRVRGAAVRNRAQLAARRTAAARRAARGGVAARRSAAADARRAPRRPRDRCRDDRRPRARDPERDRLHDHRGAAEHLLPARGDRRPAELPARVGKPAPRAAARCWSTSRSRSTGSASSTSSTGGFTSSTSATARPDCSTGS